MIKVALADDHHKMRAIWDYILSANPLFKVVAKCSNGQEALEAAVLYAPDVFLMDINMRPVSGIEATAIIARRYPWVRIIGMSMYSEESYVNHMLQAGAQGYVTKNTPYEEVVEAIEQVYAGQQYFCKEITTRVPGLLQPQVHES